MTYREIKQKQKQISELNIKIAVLRANANNTTQTLSQAPSSSGIKDKVGTSVTLIEYYECKKRELVADIESALSSLPDTLEGNCIRLKIKNRRTWVQIALKVGGNNTADNIRMKCNNYHW